MRTWKEYLRTSASPVSRRDLMAPNIVPPHIRKIIPETLDGNGKVLKRTSIRKTGRIVTVEFLETDAATIVDDTSVSGKDAEVVSGPKMIFELKLSKHLRDLADAEERALLDAEKNVLSEAVGSIATRRVLGGLGDNPVKEVLLFK